MEHNLLPLNLQFFAEGDPPPVPNSTPPVTAPPAPGEVIQQVPIDYEKLSQAIAGKQEVAENAVLRGFFEQQGLSKEEMGQAIKSFKEQRAASQPDVEDILRQAETAKSEALKEKIKNEAIMMSAELEIELKNIAPVLKLADLTAVSDAGGNVEKEKLKAAIKKVLEEIPVFKTNGASGKPQFIRGTRDTYKPEQVTDEKAYLDHKYKNNPYYKGIQGGN